MGVSLSWGRVSNRALLLFTVGEFLNCKSWGFAIDTRG